MMEIHRIVKRVSKVQAELYTADKAHLISELEAISEEHKNIKVLYLLKSTENFTEHLTRYEARALKAKHQVLAGLEDAVIGVISGEKQYTNSMLQKLLDTEMYTKPTQRVISKFDGGETTFSVHDHYMTV